MIPQAEMAETAAAIIMGSPVCGAFSVFVVVVPSALIVVTVLEPSAFVTVLIVFP